MPKVKSVGIIIVRFPPPIPKDFGRALKQRFLERLPDDTECGTSNTGSMGGPAGWAFDIRIRRVADTSTSVAIVQELLKGPPTVDALQMEVSERRGPVQMALGDAQAPEELQFPAGTNAWAEIFLKLPSTHGERDALVEAANAAIRPYGKVTHAVKLSTINMTARVDDAGNLGPCLQSLVKWLEGVAAQISVCTESQAEITHL